MKQRTRAFWGSSSPASGLAIGAAIALAIVYGIFQFLSTQPVTTAPPNPMAETSVQQFPPAPRVEEHPAVEIQELHAKEDSLLSTYGWTDKDGRRGPDSDRSRHRSRTAARVPGAERGSQEMKHSILAIPFTLLAGGALLPAQIYHASGADATVLLAVVEKSRHRSKDGRASATRSGFQR